MKIHEKCEKCFEYHKMDCFGIEDRDSNPGCYRFAENKVWSILEKEKWTEGGVKHIENIHDAIVRIIRKADIEDMRILELAIDEHLYEVMDILAEYVREKE